MTSVCFDALSNRSRQCEYAFARIIHANNSREYCQTSNIKYSSVRRP